MAINQIGLRYFVCAVGAVFLLSLIAYWSSKRNYKYPRWMQKGLNEMVNKTKELCELSTDPKLIGTNPYLACYYADYASAYVEVLYQLTNESDLKTLTGIKLSELDNEAKRATNDAKTNLSKACPTIGIKGNKSQIKHVRFAEDTR